MGTTPGFNMASMEQVRATRSSRRRCIGKVGKKGQMRASTEGEMDEIQVSGTNHAQTFQRPPQLMMVGQADGLCY